MRLFRSPKSQVHLRHDFGIRNIVRRPMLKRLQQAKRHLLLVLHCRLLALPLKRHLYAIWQAMMGGEVGTQCRPQSFGNSQPAANRVLDSRCPNRDVRPPIALKHPLKFRFSALDYRTDILKAQQPCIAKQQHLLPDDRQLLLASIHDLVKHVAVKSDMAVHHERHEVDPQTAIVRNEWRQSSGNPPRLLTFSVSHAPKAVRISLLGILLTAAGVEVTGSGVPFIEYIIRPLLTVR